ncbi:MAG: D-alanyl-D-alanine carboxypeptidase/D-alanyl-D-alanine-endopeptidase [Muribaculaceae bacterium]|nr:D-alanyl-D-alanine carboxypeptidase/D-alanyl-D-alanine-endopeptidase [Muribaculaceae bacterium]
MKNIFGIAILFFLANISLKAQCPLIFDGNEEASVGIYIEDLKTGEILVSYNDRKALTPASIQKSLTTATALQLLGPYFRFDTGFDLIGPDPLNGACDIVVSTSGDPTTGSREFKETSSLPEYLVSAIKEFGLSEITGNIVFNDSILPDAGIVPQWEVEDLEWSYGVGLYPFNWFDNYLESDYIITNPPQHFAETLMEKLARDSITLSATFFEEDVPNDTIFLFRTLSAPLIEIMHSLMVRSDNLMAEGTLRAIAPYQNRDSAIVKLKSFWKENGIDLKNSRMFDGSGLSRGNAFSPAQIGSILSFMARSENCDDYVSIFPVAGKEGTVKSFLRKTPLEGKMAVKSGSMTGVHCYAGYLLDDNLKKPTHTVVVMVNNFFCPRTQLREAIERYLIKTLN